MQTAVVCIQHNDIAWGDEVPPIWTGIPILPMHVRVAPSARMNRVQIGTPSSTRSSTSRTAASTKIAAPPRTFTPELAAFPKHRHRMWVWHRQHQHFAGTQSFDDCMDHEVVALAAKDGSGWARRATAEDELDEGEIDQPLPAGEAS